MSNKLKRMAIFRHCASAASKLLDVSDSVYLCPICGQGYFEKCAISGELTLEDVPPKAIGGKGLLLTCRDCNSKAGHKIDYHIKNHYDLNKFKKIILGKSNNEKARGNVSIFGENFPVIVEKTTNATEIRFIKSANDPKKVESFKKKCLKHRIVVKAMVWCLILAKP